MSSHDELVRSDPASPCVSVVIPAFNRAGTIERALRSVLAQTYQDYEIIVVDDASTDDTADVAASVGDPRVRVLRHTRNLGPSAARNTGIRASSSPFVAFLDSDDEWLPDKLAHQFRWMQSAAPSVGLVNSGWEYAGGGSRKIRIPTERGWLYRIALRKNVVPYGCTCALLRRECLEDVGLFDEALRYAEDQDLWIRIAKKYQIDFVPLVLARVTTSEPNRLTLDAAAAEEAFGILAARYRPEMSWLQFRAVHAKRLAHVAIRWYRSGHRERARQALWTSIVTNPLGWPAWRILPAVVLPARVFVRLRSIWSGLRGR